MSWEEIIDCSFDHVMFIFFSKSVLNIMNMLEVYRCPGFSNEMWIPQIQSFLEETGQFNDLSNGEEIGKQILIMVYLVLTA